MSCHSVLEFDEVRMFHKLGHEIFSPSAYYNPQSTDFLRPGIPGLSYDQRDIDVYNTMHQSGAVFPDAKDHLTTEFLEPFDVVIVMGMSDRWVVDQWDVLQDKIVIWRTIGQSNPEEELKVKRIKDRCENLKIVRYSPTERTIRNFAGEDVLIRFGKRPDEYFGWTGQTSELMTLCQSMQERGTSTSWSVFNEIASSIPSKLYGLGNDGNEHWNGNVLTSTDLAHKLRDHRVYFYGGTKPANYTMNFIEAWMTGIPIVAVGPRLGNGDGYNTYEIPDLIENGVNGFYSDNISELKQHINQLLGDHDLCKSIGKSGRKAALSHFDEYDREVDWETFLKTL